MVKLLLYYIQRTRDLGLLRTIQRAWLRGVKTIKISSQSLWWSWKARQELSDAMLLRQTVGQWDSLDAFIDHLASRPASTFLFPHESPDETLKVLYRDYPEYISAVLVTADAVCRNEISLLGQVFHYPNGVDWQAEPVTGWHCPLLHISRMGEYLWSPTRPADYRLLWELNRHQHFISLGIAYWLTGKQSYVDAFCSQVQSWIDTNPIQHGINWYSSMEVSLRLLAWTVSFQFFRHSPEFRKRIGKAFIKSLWQQGDFLSKHLQDTVKGEIPNNHMIGELTGQIIVAATFPEFRAANAWRDKGLELLRKQAIAQTHSDGVNKEQATGYQRFVVEYLFLVIAYGRRNILPQDSILEDVLCRMLEYVLFNLTPVGKVPMWGDADYGRVLGLGKNKDFADFRPILATGASLFSRADWKFAAGGFDEEAFWLLGTDGLRSWEKIIAKQPSESSKAFPDAGLYIIRDDWNPDTDVAFFRCGPFGLGGEKHCAHAHCDLLSFILWMRGEQILVDSGTYTYHGSWREYFRLTSAHNTVMMDNRDHSIPMTHFNWEQVLDAKNAGWTGTSVTGLLTYFPNVEFVRELKHPQIGKWDINDKFSGENKNHTLTWFFHFAPGLTLHIDDISERVIVEKDARPYVIISYPKDVRLEIRNGWVSESYGNKESNAILYGNWNGVIPMSSIGFSWQFVDVTKNK